MAKLSFFIACETITGNGSGPVINVPMLAIRPPVIPSAFSFSASVGITDLPKKDFNELQIQVYDSDNNKIYSSPINKLPLITPNGSKMPYEYEGFVIGLDIRNLFFACNGEYRFEFYLNGEKFGECKIPVYARG